MTYPFNTKEEYLAYRKLWKAEYKALTQTIREAKLLNRLYQKICTKAHLETYTPGQYRNYLKYFDLVNKYMKEDETYQKLKSKYDVSKKPGWFFPPRYSLKDAATKMLEELKNAKIEAQRQYLDQKQKLCDCTSCKEGW